ncbi:hypothetical protein PCC7424_1786 [Gloeothece citriformis PCC 7424]|uniref:Uncharacterized protein n=1 Tax=Gloeothece citriformis (strain PCC 7424) TaxID=65393 RepID=B7KCB5_GLOC7|nr:hypothetical protein [Gloeothece citriformis]ACK70220.1 hypothetical protein PCC7424_1786 [Gloeothece citriformis PCC 7424]
MLPEDKNSSSDYSHASEQQNSMTSTESTSEVRENLPKSSKKEAEIDEDLKNVGDD